MVYRFQLAYDEIIDILDLNYIPTKKLDYSIPPGKYEIHDIKFLLTHLLPKEVKVDISMYSNSQTLKFKRTKPRETFHFNPPISIEGSWLIGLASLEVYNSFLILTEENNKFELYKFP